CICRRGEWRSLLLREAWMCRRHPGSLLCSLQELLQRSHAERTSRHCFRNSRLMDP
ncbi:hypothetical protein KIL84_003618, partial [Mauremys mutica]